MTSHLTTTNLFQSIQVNIHAGDWILGHNQWFLRALCHFLYIIMVGAKTCPYSHQPSHENICTKCVMVSSTNLIFDSKNLTKQIWNINISSDVNWLSLSHFLDDCLLGKVITHKKTAVLLLLLFLLNDHFTSEPWTYTSFRKEWHLLAAWPSCHPTIQIKAPTVTSAWPYPLFIHHFQC